MNNTSAVEKYTEISIDTADINTVKKFQVHHCTTNPSLVLKASLMPQYNDLLIETAFWLKQNPELISSLANMGHRLSVLFGIELSKIVSGFIFTEIDPSLSFDSEKTKMAARQIIQWYEELGCNRERTQIKIAATWPGIQAAAELEKEKIQCTMTLLFSPVQAIACANAGVSMIAPYVARVTDWYKMRGENRKLDPGVENVSNMYKYYKKFGYKTKIIAASFRDIEQVRALYGCDYLTVPPTLLKELETELSTMPIILNEESKLEYSKQLIAEKDFYWLMSQDAMATEKLAEGLRSFHSSFVQLGQLIKKAVLKY